MDEGGTPSSIETRMRSCRIRSRVSQRRDDGHWRQRLRRQAHPPSSATQRSLLAAMSIREGRLTSPHSEDGTLVPARCLDVLSRDRMIRAHKCPGLFIALYQSYEDHLHAFARIPSSPRRSSFSDTNTREFNDEFRRHHANQPDASETDRRLARPCRLARVRRSIRPADSKLVPGIPPR